MHEKRDSQLANQKLALAENGWWAFHCNEHLYKLCIINFSTFYLSVETEMSVSFTLFKVFFFVREHNTYSQNFELKVVG